MDINSLRVDTSLGVLLHGASIDSKHILQTIERSLDLTEPLSTTIPLSEKSIAALEVEALRISIHSKRELLTCLSSSGSKTPLFLFPPGTGDIIAWLCIVRYLSDRPIYAFRLKGIVPGEAAFQSLDELLE